MTRINCQSAGTLENGSPCRFFDMGLLVCTYQPGEGQTGCLFQIDVGFTEEQLARHEAVGIEPEVSDKIERVRAGVDRLKDLWSEEIYRSISDALEAADKYRPSSPAYNLGALDSLQILNADIIHISAFGFRIATMIGEAQATFKEIDKHRHIMHGQKFKAVKESYEIGLRRGKRTDKAMEFDVRCDPEYIQIMLDTMRAEQQVDILKFHYQGLVELVNALKYQITTLQGEWRRRQGA